LKDELFYELQTSIKEGGKILRGKKKASREFDFENPNPKVIRKNLRLLQNKYQNN